MTYANEADTYMSKERLDELILNGANKRFTDAWSYTKELLRVSQHFILPSYQERNRLIVASIPKNSILFGDMEGPIHLPFPYVSFSYDNSIGRNIIFAHNSESSTEHLFPSGSTIISKAEGLKVDGSYIWVPGMILCVIHAEDPSKIKHVKWFDGFGAEKPSIQVPGKPHLDMSIDYRESEEIVNTDLTIFAFVIKFLSCKNIETKRITVPPAIQKKRAKKGKRPLFDHHILVLKPTKGLDRDTGRPGGPRSAFDTRIHLCRGHFKEFTADKPLFGRVTGCFWWQPTVRGNKNAGMVTKDYEIRL